MSKLGAITGVHRSREYPVAASQKFNRTGGAFVTLDSSGNIRLALTADTVIFGWAVVPQGVGSGLGTDPLVWQSSATAGADRLPVITKLSNEYLMPSSAAVTEAMKDLAYDLIAVNDGTQQVLNVGASATSLLIVTATGTAAGANSTSYGVVRINPVKQIAHT